VNINAILRKYFILRQGIGGGGPLGRDPTSSRIPSSDFNSSIAVLCDVGVCLAALSDDHRGAIYDRWEVWFRLDDAHSDVASWSRKAVSSLIANRRGARKRARAKKKDCIEIVDDLTARLRAIDRNQRYITAVGRLKHDIEDRHNHAVDVFGDRAGFSGA